MFYMAGVKYESSLIYNLIIEYPSWLIACRWADLKKAAVRMDLRLFWCAQHGRWL